MTRHQGPHAWWSWLGRAGGVGVTMHGSCVDSFEMRLWEFGSCCDCL